MSDAAPWEHVITQEKLLGLYDTGMERGGIASLPTAGCLEQCLGDAWTAEGYRQDEGVFVGILFAGYLGFYLAKNHCFTDGNKRIAWLSIVYVLGHHGVAIEATDDDVVATVDGVVTGDVSLDQLLEWMVIRIVETPDLVRH